MDTHIVGKLFHMFIGSEKMQLMILRLDLVGDEIKIRNC